MHTGMYSSVLVALAIFLMSENPVIYKIQNLTIYLVQGYSFLEVNGDKEYHSFTILYVWSIETPEILSLYRPI